MNIDWPTFYNRQEKADKIGVTKAHCKSENAGNAAAKPCFNTLGNLHEVWGLHSSNKKEDWLSGPAPGQQWGTSPCLLRVRAWKGFSHFERAPAPPLGKIKIFPWETSSWPLSELCMFLLFYLKRENLSRETSNQICKARGLSMWAHPQIFADWQREKNY